MRKDFIAGGLGLSNIAIHLSRTAWTIVEFAFFPLRPQGDCRALICSIAYPLGFESWFIRRRLQAPCFDLSSQNSDYLMRRALKNIRVANQEENIDHSLV